MKRRHFIKNTIAGGLVCSKSSFLPEIAISAEKFEDALVIATWNNEQAVRTAYEVLANNGYALDAVEAGIKIPEANPEDTSVGYGGFPDRDGDVTLDACIMDENGNTGSVSFLEQIMHPISVARKVMEKTPHVMLVGAGAQAFALSEGFKKENLLTPKAKAAWEDWKIKSQYKPVINVERHDTIGLLAIDKKGRMCGGCSTSGLAFKMKGRVGDSPVIGAGLFVAEGVGACTATGLGEIMLKNVSSFLVVEEMRRGRSPQIAVETAIKRIVKKYPDQVKDAQACLLAIDEKGRYGAFSIHPGFNFAVIKNGNFLLIESNSYFTT